MFGEEDPLLTEDVFPHGWKSGWLEAMLENFAERNDSLQRLIDEDDAEAAKVASEFLSDFSIFCRKLIGVRVLRAGYSRMDDHAKAVDDELWQSYWRMLLWTPVLALDDDTLHQDLMTDLGYILSGDAPLLLARRGAGKKGRSEHFHRIARLKFEALLWAEHFKASGMRSIDWKYRVATAFGREWETISKWKAECKTNLTSDYVERALLQVKSSACSSACADFPEPLPMDHASVEDAGNTFQMLIQQENGHSPAARRKA
ncbi:hypothetical protein GCM10011371_18290 [Novosphingobium marinum]|uniref:Uncharacterized protein n=1 Tax=Novosphingobium marinum TaxID=1514948 RepID=A0A7Y9XZQ0_9SPHN|nr:hypothetical protein [Novosphingobium marinum]NYH95941.1 hypothetical protein [Novosphingobium marinum]GGC31188.1 hypothetical protein GCM10011371_18290 [Novosphingobium marinum]